MAQMTSYDIAERLRKYYNVSKKKEKLGAKLIVDVCKKRSNSRNSGLSRNPGLRVQACTISTISFQFNNCMLRALIKAALG